MDNLDNFDNLDNLLECVVTNLYEEEFQVVKRSVHGVASTFSEEVSHPNTCWVSHRHRRHHHQHHHRVTSFCR